MKGLTKLYEGQQREGLQEDVCWAGRGEHHDWEGTACRGQCPGRACRTHLEAGAVGRADGRGPAGVWTRSLEEQAPGSVVPAAGQGPPQEVVRRPTRGT